jgi:hypothetical protein
VWLLLSLALLVWASVGQAAERFDNAWGVEWKYKPDERLVAFYLYISTKSGVYDWDSPVASVPAIPEMVTELAREELILPGPGTYYAVVRAMSMDGKDDSDPSNEISFVYGYEIKPPPPLPPMTPAPPKIPKPVLPPKVLPPNVSVPVKPPTTSATGFVDQCMWRGGAECRPGSLTPDTKPSQVPPAVAAREGSFVNECMWRGGPECKPEHP